MLLPSNSSDHQARLTVTLAVKLMAITLLLLLASACAHPSPKRATWQPTVSVEQLRRENAAGKIKRPTSLAVKLALCKARPQTCRLSDQHN